MKNTKSYDQLLGIMQGYQKTVNILTEIRDNTTDKEIRKAQRNKDRNYLLRIT